MYIYIYIYTYIFGFCVLIQKSMKKYLRIISILEADKKDFTINICFTNMYYNQY